MEKKKKSTNNQKISSRNRNGNRNKNLQIRAKEKELAKKERARRREEELEAIDEDDPSFVGVKIDKFRFVDTDTEKGSDKFVFVDLEAEDEKNIDELEEFHEYTENKQDVVQEVIKEEKINVKDVHPEEKIIPSTTDHVDIDARKYISYESRVVGLLVIIILSFFIAGLLIFNSITHTDSKAIKYAEKGSSEYKVCVNDNAAGRYYDKDCLAEDMEYLSSITEKIPVTFRYEVNFNKEVSSKLNYYVTTKVNIYREKNGKVLNTMEDVVVERTAYNVFGDKAEISIDVDVPFKKYSNYVNSYNAQYGLDSYALLDVVFYVDNGNVIKEISSLNMPISTKTFSVRKNEVQSEEQDLTIALDSWGGVNTSYAVVGVIFVLFGLMGIIRLSNLVYRVINTSSIYQRKLSKILREYDKYIVISRGDYVVDSNKKLIKVTTFSELLDARNTLEKPIVYVKVNNVKSAFYVEDTDIIYKYTMKEADFEGK